ncbi:hypothetical protein [Sulfurovum sp.]|uniref:hypothetical protein n=1 Tax=Sulfurovum sp. TaxID=1969726 RepID=UPI0028681700|nr:hypothetical protein [Sulfurovum sp.]
MKKPLLLFLGVVVLFIIAKVVYTKYCASKVEGCKEEKFEDTILNEDHVDH